MYQVELTEDTRADLQARTRAPGIKPRTRDRLEMVRLSDLGLSIPQIARHLRLSARRVRFWIREYLRRGFDALADKPYPGRPGRLTPALVAQVRELFAREDRTWTARQLAIWLSEEHHVSFSPNHLRHLLRRFRLSSRRTERDLGHKQDPQEVAVITADLQTLEKGAMRAAWTSAM